MPDWWTINVKWQCVRKKFREKNFDFLKDPSLNENFEAIFKKKLVVHKRTLDKVYLRIPFQLNLIFQPIEKT